MRLNRKQLRKIILEALGSDEDISKKFQEFNDKVTLLIQTELGEPDLDRIDVPKGTALTYKVMMEFPDAGGYKWKDWKALGGKELDALTELVKEMYNAAADSNEFKQFIDDVSKEFGNYGPFEIKIAPPQIKGRNLDMDVTLNESKITRKRLRSLINRYFD